MRIVIDLQGAQTESRFRGIGRYTLAFTQAVVRNRGEHEVILALSGLFPESIDPIRAAFDGLLPQENILIWHAPGPVREDADENKNRRQVAEHVREKFLASLLPDIIHVCSLFEGYEDDAVTSIGEFDRHTKVSVTIYDLIPLLRADKYLSPNPKYKDHYFKKIDYLRKASSFIAISESSRQEVINSLQLSDGSVINASLGVDAIFKVVKIDCSESQSLREKFGINRPFALYTGGADERKNLKRLIEAWSLLPEDLRQGNQLIFAGRMPENYVLEFRRFASSCGLSSDDLLFSGYISDEDLVKIYNLCKFFVFPSLHEGFGLPALEAMACGAAVIAANTTSLPEVVGLNEALFDPMNIEGMRKKIHDALVDEDYLTRLREHSLVQARKFTWDSTAQCAIEVWENEVKKKDSNSDLSSLRRKINYPDLLNVIAPFLHENGRGELLTLATQIAQNDSAGLERQLFLDISELCRNDAATGVQRVVRSYLCHLLRNPPSGFRVEPVYASIDEGYRYAREYTQRFSVSAIGISATALASIDAPIRWQRGDIFFGLDMQHHVQLKQADFYARLRHEGVVVKFLVYDLLPIQLEGLFKDSDIRNLHEQWLEMISKQDMAICISKSTADAYKDWIEKNKIYANSRLGINWVHMGADLDGSMPSKGLPADAPALLETLKSCPTFLAVSTIEPRKCQAQILDAVEKLWIANENVNLVFVGQLGWRTESLAHRIESHIENGRRLFWLKGISDEFLDEIYACSTCLIAASINEGFGLPLIEAARHGIPIIARDIPVFREVAGENAFYFDGDTAEDLASNLSIWLESYREDTCPKSLGIRWLTWQESTEVLKSRLVKENYSRKQLLVDISELAQRDARTGIQRVVRSILGEWLKNPPDDYRIEPVYATVEQGYRYARRFTARFSGRPDESIVDEIIDYSPGDIFFSLDLNHHVPRVHRGFLEKLYAAGVDVRFMVYDLLPVQFPEFWDPKHKVHEVVDEWMSIISTLGGVVCISRTVAEEMSEWIRQKAISHSRSFKIDWFHLGADVSCSLPTRGLPTDAEATLELLRCRTSFLMVGTLEPRKGHFEIIDAFDAIWKSGLAVNLVIVGKEGWMVDSLISRLKNHPQRDRQLFWLEEASDEYLENIYDSSSCLIAASYGEGFGLPLIEAAQHGLPILARDIKVFREVAGDHASYFESGNTQELSNTIIRWMDLFSKNLHVSSENMPWLTWNKSAKQLIEILKNVG
jgi:glycosyltransferase involved in cell wall biosynthesis